MRTLMAFFILNLFFQNLFAASDSLTPFQKNVKSCLKDQVDVSKLKSLDKLYEVLTRTFKLRSSETVYREVLFKEKSELKKLKLQDGKIAIYKVLNDKTVVLLNNDARQNGLTDDSSMNQLLVRADIISDWLRVKETRSDQTTLIYNRVEGQLKSFSFEKAQQKSKLECSQIELSDICLCRP